MHCRRCRVSCRRSSYPFTSKTQPINSRYEGYGVSPLHQSGCSHVSLKVINTPGPGRESQLMGLASRTWLLGTSRSPTLMFDAKYDGGARGSGGPWSGAVLAQRRSDGHFDLWHPQCLQGCATAYLIEKTPSGGASKTAVEAGQGLYSP